MPFLEERGFTVESATNGSEALEALKRLRPDVIVTDMQMPKMSGSELITALKSKPETVDMPIIIVTSKGTDCSEKEKRANFTICKDIDIEEQLGKALDALWGKCRPRTNGREVAVTTSSTRSFPPPPRSPCAAKSFNRNLG